MWCSNTLKGDDKCSGSFRRANFSFKTPSPSQPPPARLCLKSGCVCAEYEVVTVTGSAKMAGTNANVFITIFGKTGQTPRLQLKDSNNDRMFQRSQSDIFLLKTKCVGPLKKIRYIRIFRWQNLNLNPQAILFSLCAGCNWRCDEHWYRLFFFHVKQIKFLQYYSFLSTWFKNTNYRLDFLWPS